MPSNPARLDVLLREIRTCRLCEAHLPHGPRPVLQAGAGARILVVGQAPGVRVHESGVPWKDASGERLRDWMGISDDVFYDARHVALVPTGFCYPGRGTSGDLPPRPECAATWHRRLLALMPDVRLTLLVGQHAQAFMLGERCKATLTETVAGWRDRAPSIFCLPHPSPRNNIWLKKNPWFSQELAPELRARVGWILAAE